MATKWGVWIRQYNDGWGLRAAEAESAEHACAIVRQELNAGKNGIVGRMMSEIAGAEPHELAMTRQSESEVRVAVGWPAHDCDVCEDWFVTPHSHAKVGQQEAAARG